MELSDVKIRLVNQDGKLKGVASLVIDGCFAVHDIKIVEGEGGVFVAMPSRKTPDGEYKDIVHPINSQTLLNCQKRLAANRRIHAVERADAYSPPRRIYFCISSYGHIRI